VGRLRDFDPEYFDAKLSFTNAGLLDHSLPCLRVASLSGIGLTGSNASRNPPENKTWPQIMATYKYGKISPKALSHYRQADVEAALKVGSAHLLLTHDRPVDPRQINIDQRWIFYDYARSSSSAGITTGPR
jgi:hypothetical protein